MRKLVFLSFIFSLSLVAKVEIDQLERAITNRLDKVTEFAKIKEIAAELHIKEAYLFGGTASAWAHYIYADLEREEGSAKFYKEHFDYDYTSVFRSNQDMDIAIDGTVEQAEALEKKLQELFPHFQGKKSVFEVRLLNATRGDKDAILNNSDFLNQNNDSHSTGLIELAGDGKKTIQDVKDMKSLTPEFLKDVYAKKLHFYYDHAKHITTKRYLAKQNPEIFAVIRYLTKAFQYELEIDAESQKAILKIINEFDPTEMAKQDSYVAYWLNKNGPKLFQNAVNMEYAWNTLEKLGLRKKLIAVDHNINEQYSLAWWMNKEPLRSFELGKGNGKTAKELGLDIVAHETNSFEAYESMTKAHAGDPNVFISRGETGKEFANEMAAYGEGFYVREGKLGGRGTGITIRFQLDPKAKEGSDFEIAQSGLVIKNKRAIKVIPESITLSALDYFKKISKGELVFDKNDKGVLEKLRRKFLNRRALISKRDEQKILAMVRSAIRDNSPTKESLVREFSNIYLAKGHPEFLDWLIGKGEARLILEEVWAKNLYPNMTSIIKKILSRESTFAHNSSYTIDQLVKPLFENPLIFSDPELIELLLSKNSRIADSAIIYRIIRERKFSKEERYKWGDLLYKNWLKRAEEKAIPSDLLAALDPTEFNSNLTSRIYAYPLDNAIQAIDYVLSSERWQDSINYFTLVEKTIDRATQLDGLFRWHLLMPLTKLIFSNPDLFLQKPLLVQKFIAIIQSQDDYTKKMANLDEYLNRPVWKEYLNKQKKSLDKKHGCLEAITPFLHNELRP